MRRWIGLSAEVRAVSRSDARLKEAAKLGFKRAITPPVKAGGKHADARPKGLSITEIDRLGDLTTLFDDDGQMGRRVGAG